MACYKPDRGDVASKSEYLKSEIVACGHFCHVSCSFVTRGLIQCCISSYSCQGGTISQNEIVAFLHAYHFKRLGKNLGVDTPRRCTTSGWKAGFGEGRFPRRAKEQPFSA